MYSQLFKVPWTALVIEIRLDISLTIQLSRNYMLKFRKKINNIYIAITPNTYFI